MLKTSKSNIFTIFTVLLAVQALHTSGAEQQEQQQKNSTWVATHGPITSVPGYIGGKLPSKHYGGYISVGNKQLYYYMVESERSPAKDPVV